MTRLGTADTRWTRRVAFADDAGVDIRGLTSADVPYLKELSADRGWLREDIRWALLVEAAEVYGVDAPDGGLAGAVALTRYDTHTKLRSSRRYAAIGMMLVARRFAGQGLGRRLMTHAVTAAAGTVALTATEYGRPLYERLGFVGHGTSTIWTGQLPPTAPSTRPLDDIAEILPYDADAFGADRSALLTRLPSFARIRAAAKGYGAAWRNGDLTVLGPIVAEDLVTAQALASDLAAEADTPIRLDITTAQPAFAAWAATHLARGETTTVMSYGGPVPGDPTRVYTPFSVATG